MKRILSYIYFIILFLASIELFATNWYVDNTASGLNNGTSWTNAWESFADINWASISAGDYIYISGGSVSKTYNETLEPAVEGTSVNRVTITIGKYSPSPSGHDGRVIIQGAGGAYGILITQYLSPRPDYITFKGFEITNVDLGVYINSDFAITGLIFDSLNIYNYVGGAGIKFECNPTGYVLSNTIIRNCTILSCANCSGETDGIFSKGASNTFIYNNWIRIINQDPLQHVDAIQGYQSNGFVIYNNILINDSVNSQEGGGIPIILGSEGNNPVIIFNNFLYMGGVHKLVTNQASVMLMRWYDLLPMPNTWVFNNTCVSNGRNIRNFDLEYAEKTKTRIHNNIIAMYSTYASNNLESFLINNDQSTSDGLFVDSVRNNLFYRSWENDVVFAGDEAANEEFYRGSTQLGIPTGWTDWINNFGGTGVLGDPDLVSNIGYEPDQSDLVPDIEATSPAIDAGEDLSYLYSYFLSTYSYDLPILEDIYGNARSDWDIGAVEYTTGGWTPPDTTGTVSFTSVSNAELSSYHIAYGVVSGIDSTSHVYTATSDSFAVGYPYTLGLGIQSVENGDTIAVSNIASGSYSTANINYIVLSGTSRSFTVTTKAALDTLPNAFTFTDITGATRSTVYTSNAITLAGFDSAYARAGGAEYQVNSGSWVTGYTEVFPNDNIRVRLTSSASYSTATNVPLTVGSRSDTYTVTTGAQPVTPPTGAPIKDKNGIPIRDSNGKLIRTP